MSNKIINHDHASMRIDQFARITTKFADAAGRSGCSIIPFHGSQPEHFAALPGSMQVDIMNKFFRYAEAAEMVLQDGALLDSGHKFLWRMICNLNLRPTNDLFSILEPDDVIEIYNVPEFVQIFRNLRFFYNCSYTLDEILCRPFWELFKRDQDVTDAIMKTANTVANQTVPITIAYNIPPHTLEEIDSQSKFICQVENKFISPLMNKDNQIMALVNVMSGQVCESLMTGIPRMRLEQPNMEK